MKIERKEFSFKLEDVDSKGVIRGYASIFGNEDSYGDIVDAGAFKKSIQESKGLWPILADHNPSDQIGWNMRAQENDRGLLVEGQINMKVAKGVEKYELAKQAMELGANMGLSIGYMPVKAEPDRNNSRLRRLKEIKMYEYSIVTFPANTEAFITQAKSLVADGVTFDKVKSLIAELKKLGVLESDLLMALHGAAPKSEDPTKISQSMDKLLAALKS